MANSADLYQLTSEANLSGSTLSAKAGYTGFSRTRAEINICYMDTAHGNFLLLMGRFMCNDVILVTLLE